MVAEHSSPITNHTGCWLSRGASEKVIILKEAIALGLNICSARGDTRYGESSHLSAFGGHSSLVSSLVFNIDESSNYPPHFLNEVLDVRPLKGE